MFNPEPNGSGFSYGEKTRVLEKENGFCRDNKKKRPRGKSFGEVFSLKGRRERN